MRRLATLSLAVVGLASLSVDAAAAPGFKPADGRYRGEYTSGYHGPGSLRLQVETLRPSLHGVRLVRWSGKLRCPGDRMESVSVPLTAARAGRTFSGYTTSTSGKSSFTGKFTARDALSATVRVTRGRCKTGPITFDAHRVGP